MNLRIGAQTADALDVASQKRVVGELVGKMTEGLSSGAEVLALIGRRHYSADIIVVFAEFAHDDTFDATHWSSGTIDELENVGRLPPRN